MVCCCCHWRGRHSISPQHIHMGTERLNLSLSNLHVLPTPRHTPEQLGCGGFSGCSEHLGRWLKHSHLLECSESGFLTAASPPCRHKVLLPWAILSKWNSSTPFIAMATSLRTPGSYRVKAYPAKVPLPTRVWGEILRWCPPMQEQEEWSITAAGLRMQFMVYRNVLCYYCSE